MAGRVMPHYSDTPLGKHDASLKSMSAANAQRIPGMNRQVRLAARPVGPPRESDFRLSESAAPRAASGEALIQALYLSIDPHIRVRMGGAAAGLPALNVGDVMPGAVVGRVVESNDPRLAHGDIVEGMLGWQEFAVAHAKDLRRVDPAVASISAALYPLGLPGMAAYFGLLEICHPQPGETVVVSAAAGAVGSLVGQIARIKRCRAVGIAGSAAKIDFITRELGIDAGVNYREAGYGARLKELCPNGVDVYFDNVGGEITDSVIRLLNSRARVAVCGQVSQYNAPEPVMGPRWLGQLITKQAKVEGFQAQQFAGRFDEAARQISAWLRDGRLKYHEEIVDGLQSAPAAFIEVLEGRSVGKRLVRLAG
jgi:NADPH-dependent curcumin reductase CurA